MMKLWTLACFVIWQSLSMITAHGAHIIIDSDIGAVKTHGGHMIVSTDIGAVDPDDAIAIHALKGFGVLYPNLEFNAFQFSFISEHIDPLNKARALSLITQSHHIYAGSGIELNCSTEELLDKTPMFPTQMFGMPMSDDRANPDVKRWFPDHLKAYKEVFGEDAFFGAPIQNKSGVDHIIELAEAHSPKDPLYFLSLAPMLTLYDALQKRLDLGQNIVVFSMGGCQEKNRDAWLRSDVGTAKEITSPGYNWGICPKQTDFVLRHVQRTYVVSSQLPRDCNFKLTKEYFEKLSNNEKIQNSQQGQAFFRDRAYCQKGNALGEQTMCDPMTLLMSLLICSKKKDSNLDVPSVTFTPVHVTFPCLDDQGNVKPEFINQPYFSHPEAMRITKADKSNLRILFLQELPRLQGALDAVGDWVEHGLIHTDMSSL